VELRVDGTLEKGQFRVQPVWDEAETGHTMVVPRQKDQFKTTMATGSILPETDSTNVAPESTESEQTVVRARPKTLYSIELWHQGVRQAVVPIIKPEITIGRGSRSVSVDLPIKGDPEISRVHATLTRDENGTYWLTSKGRNPTLLSGREIPREDRTQVTPDQKIDICSYTLRIQPS
jgi:hypothetical protein